MPGLSENGENDLVSVVMIFLDAERFIEEAIRSLLAQTHDRWELLLVDDGSTDGSTEIARRFASEIPSRVRYLEHEGHRNLGMSASRNLGIRQSRGRFVAFLDSDDVWLPRKLERQAALMARWPRAAMVCGPTLWWRSWTGEPADARGDAMRELGVPYDRLYEPPELLTRLLQGHARTPATCGVLLRREAVDEVGGFEDAFRGMYEDQVFFAKVYHRHPTYVTGESLDWYRQHPESHCSLAEKTGAYDSSSYNAAHRAFLLWLSDYLEAQGDPRADLRLQLDRALWPYRHPLLNRVRGLPSWVRRAMRKPPRSLARAIVRRIRGAGRRPGARLPQPGA